MKYALIIGNDRYEDPKLAQLKTPAADSQALAGILDDRQIGAFDEVISLINRSETQVRRAVSAFLADKKPADLVLLYFSGHGVLDDRGRLYLALQDTQLNLLKATSIPSSFISDEMDSCRSRRQILVLDCCHSGAFARGAKGEQKAITESTFEGSGFGRVVLTASDSTQYALEGDQVIKQTELSLFTHFLLEGLKTGEADMNNDGQISLDEWYDYTYTRVIAETPRQVPHKWSYNQQGDLVIARNPFVKKKVAELPHELTQALESSFVGIRESAVTELGKYLSSRDPDVVRLAAASLERMKEDDSRRISSLAGKLLAEFAQEHVEKTVEVEVAPVEGAQIHVAEKSSSLPIPHTAAEEVVPGSGVPFTSRSPALYGSFWLKWLVTVLLSAAGFYVLYSLSMDQDDPYNYFIGLSWLVTGLAGLAQWYFFRPWLGPWWVPVQAAAGLVLGFLQVYLYDALSAWPKEGVGVLFAVWVILSLVVELLLIRTAHQSLERPPILPKAGTQGNLFFILLSITLVLDAVFNLLLVGEAYWDAQRTVFALVGLSAIFTAVVYVLKKDIPRNFGFISLAIFLFLIGLLVEIYVYDSNTPQYFFIVVVLPALASGIFFLAQKEARSSFAFLMLSGYLIANGLATVLDWFGGVSQVFWLLAALFAVLAAASFHVRRK